MFVILKTKKHNLKIKNADVPKASVPLTDQDKIYSSVNEKVTAKSETNLRTLATTKSNIVTTLKNAIKENRISHAYLFAGPRGTGKNNSS